MLEMAKQNQAVSDPDETSETSTPEEAEIPTNGKNNRSATEYEKQRLSRIAENRKRMEALGLAKLASAVTGSGQNVGKVKNKGKGKVGMKFEDEDYQPDEGEETVDSSSEEDESRDDGDGEDDEDFAGAKDSGSRRKKCNQVKKKGVSTKKKASIQKILSRSAFIDDDDELKQAIALSLQDAAGISDIKMPDSSGVDDKNTAKTREGKGKKRKKQFISRMKMTEDELVVNFYRFDDDWKGGITVKDLRRMAAAHDFTWTERELSDMIYCFNANGDEKLSLEDFREIVGRCNMIKEPDTG